MKALKHKIIPSFLPVFCGFYETIFEPNEDYVIESPFTYEDYEFDYTGYRTNVAKACVDAIENKLKEFDINGVIITYEKISSPKYYNFETDSIYVKYKLTGKAVKNINDYLTINKEAFATYVKDNYTSRDGFNSFWSNDINDWFKIYLPNKEKLKHCFGAVLEFIFENEKYTYRELYDDVCGDATFLDGWLKENVATVTDVIATYTKENYLTKDITTITAELVVHFESEDITGDFLTYGYIEKYVIETFSEIDNKTLNLFADIK